MSTGHFVPTGTRSQQRNNQETKLKNQDSLSIHWGCSDKRLCLHRHTSRSDLAYVVDVPGGPLNTRSIEDVTTLLRLIPKIASVHLEVHTDCLGAQAMQIAEADYECVVRSQVAKIQQEFPYVAVTATCLTKFAGQVPEWRPVAITLNDAFAVKSKVA